MSEGLNLQTCGRLFNYDMPWNLMRVEQRIGRVDRIGATYELVTISNYFYAATVEQSIYASIKDDFGDFTEIVGDAQPVLAATEQVIKAAAMTGDRSQIQAAIQQIKEKVKVATSGDVRLSDAEAQTISIPELHPTATLRDLSQAMRGNKALKDWLVPDPIDFGVWELRLPHAEPRLIAFDRLIVDQNARDVSLFTWGTEEANDLAQLLADAQAHADGGTTELG